MSQAQLEAMFEREQKILDLRTTGKSFTEINRELGIKNSYIVFQRAIARDANIEPLRITP